MQFESWVKKYRDFIGAFLKQLFAQIVKKVLLLQPHRELSRRWLYALKAPGSATCRK